MRNVTTFTVIAALIGIAQWGSRIVIKQGASKESVAAYLVDRLQGHQSRKSTTTASLVPQSKFLCNIMSYQFPRCQ